jgi:hypothetical protein
MHGNRKRVSLRVGLVLRRREIKAVAVFVSRSVLDDLQLARAVSN